ncbi:MAG: hypothetical protein AAFO77_10070 [Pseudomonadota bacterium]
MTNDVDPVDEIKSAIAIARKRDLNFGLCLGKQYDGTVLLTHRHKSPDVLFKAAKKKGETTKATSGTLCVKGKTISLSCIDAPPAGTAKKLRDYMSKVADLPMKVVLLDADGQILELEGEEETEAEIKGANGVADTSKGAPGDQGAASLKALAGQLNALKSRIEAAPSDKRSALKRATKQIVQAIRNADAARARTGLQAMSQVLDRLVPETADTAEQKWQTLSAGIGTRIDMVLHTGRGNTRKLRSWKMAAEEKAAAGEFRAALAILQRLETDVENAEKEPVTQAINRIDFTKIRLAWVSARNMLRAELKRLGQVIFDTCDKDTFPGINLRQVESALLQHIDPINERLEDALDLLLKTTQPDQRRTVKAECVKLVGTYRAALASRFFDEVDQNNGFVSVRTETKPLF